MSRAGTMLYMGIAQRATVHPKCFEKLQCHAVNVPSSGIQRSSCMISIQEKNNYLLVMLYICHPSDVSLIDVIHIPTFDKTVIQTLAQRYFNLGFCLRRVFRWTCKVTDGPASRLGA